MVRIAFAGLLSLAATGLLIGALLSSSPTSGQVLAAVGLFVIADLNLIGTVLAESKRRSNRDAGPGKARAGRGRPGATDRTESAAEQAAERRTATQLLTTLEALADHQEESIAGKSAVDVVLLAPGKNKIAVIKELREHLGGGLAESKELADRAGREPVLLASGMPIEQARRISTALSNAGARVLLR